MSSAILHLHFLLDFKVMRSVRGVFCQSSQTWSGKLDRIMNKPKQIKQVGDCLVLSCLPAAPTFILFAEGDDQPWGSWLQGSHSAGTECGCLRQRFARHGCRRFWAKGLDFHWPAKTCAWCLRNTAHQICHLTSQVVPLCSFHWQESASKHESVSPGGKNVPALLFSFGVM